LLKLYLFSLECPHIFFYSHLAILFNIIDGSQPSVETGAFGLVDSAVRVLI
jgi:hypothetical protein